MQLKCNYCSTMYAIGREEAQAAIQMIRSGEKAHYDAHCPKCRRATKITRQQLERGYPAIVKGLDDKA
jgi:phage FluMu protein Com